MTEQEFLAIIGRCDDCGHALKKIAHFRVTEHYPSGLGLVPTHWSITEVGEGEDTGIGCTECEKGALYAIHRNRRDAALEREGTESEWENVYCRRDT